MRYERENVSFCRQCRMPRLVQAVGGYSLNSWFRSTLLWSSCLNDTKSRSVLHVSLLKPGAPMDPAKTPLDRESGGFW